MAKPDQDDTGRCVSCGFLAVSPFWGQDPSLREVDRSQRQNAQLGGLPVCFAQAEDLAQEVLDLANLEHPEHMEAGEFGAADFAPVIGSDRHCSEWFRYQPGMSPEQHLDRMGPEQRQILIVGWGFLGAAFGNRLLADGLGVTGLTRSATWRTETSRRAGARIVVGDARRPDVLEDALLDVDHVVFCAGGVTPPSAAADPPQAAAAILSPLLAVNEALSKRPHLALTYLSSCAAYGDPDRLPVDETEPALPISPYGALHLSAELCAQAYARRFGTPLNILRCANVYGPGQAYDRDQGVIAIFLDRISRVLPVSIFGDGLALRDYVLVDDVAAVVARIVEDRIDVGTVNVGSGQGRTVLEVVDAISRSVGASAIVDQRPRRGFEVGSVVLDIRRLSSLMPYTPTDFHRGLDMTAAEYARRRQLQVDPVGALKT